MSQCVAPPEASPSGGVILEMQPIWRGVFGTVTLGILAVFFAIIASPILATTMPALADPHRHRSRRIVARNIRLARRRTVPPHR